MEKKRSSGSVMTYVIAVIWLMTAAVLLVPTYYESCRKQSELDRLQRELKAKQQANAKLDKEVRALENSPRAVEKVARENFGLCAPGESVLKYAPDSEKKTQGEE